MRKPNAIQRLAHRIFMLRPVTEFFAPRVHLIDQAILKLTDGKHSGSEILGWNIVQLTTVGARTGQPRTLPLLGVFDGNKIALVASVFGQERNPGWYYNLKAHPECEVEFKGYCGKYIAHESAGDEYERYWQTAVSLYEGYAKYKQRAAHRRIPVMVLEPRE